MLGELLERYVTAYHLFEPLSHLHIIEGRLRVRCIQNAIYLQKCHSTDIPGSLVAINKRMIEGNACHVERCLGYEVSALIIRGVLRALNRAFQQATLSQRCVN